MTHTTPPVASLDTPPLPLTHIPTSMRDSSKNEECDECTNTVEYEKKLPITYETNNSKALIPYIDYSLMSASPEVKKKNNVVYTCTRKKILCLMVFLY